MKEVLFKKQFAKYMTLEHHNQSPISMEDYYPETYLKHPKFSVLRHTEDEETFIKELYNPLFRVYRKYLMIVIEEMGDKISFKYFHGSKMRDQGKHYFKKSKNVHFLTVNKKTGDVYFGCLNNYQKKRKFTKTIKKNFFLSNPLDTLVSAIKSNILDTDPSANAAFILREATNLFISRICEKNIRYTNEVNLFKFYLDKKNVKYPNNFGAYMPHFFSAEFRKTLKKNHYRLVDAFMEHNNLHGKKIKKHLHNANNLNIELYKIAQNMFGDNILNQDDDSILKILNSKTTVFQSLHDIRDKSDIIFNAKELKKVYNCFKKTFFENEIDSNTFIDHINFYRRLKKYGERNIRWMSDGNDLEFFRKEHLDWSDKVNFYINGDYYRSYPDYFYNVIENEIDGYFPVILKDSKAYNEESMTQSNCVKTYVGRASAFVISLRKDSIDSDVRATIEYQITKINNKIYPQRIQSLGRFNSILDSDWYEILLKLDEIVLSCFRDSKFVPVKIKKVCANGVEFFSDSEFSDYGNLTWTNQIETPNNFDFFNFEI